MRRTLIMALASLLVAGGGASITVRAQTVSPQQASPQDLAHSILTTAVMEKMIPAVRKGVTVRTTINGQPAELTRSNIEDYARALRQHRDEVAAAIESRGYPPVAGRYLSTVTAPCRAARSLALALGGEIVISQRKFQLALNQKVIADGRRIRLSHAGAVVSGVIVVTDAGTQDISYTGSVNGPVIQMRPWVQKIQDAYSFYPPDFPPRPDWSALSACVITLTRR